MQIPLVFRLPSNLRPGRPWQARSAPCHRARQVRQARSADATAEVHALGDRVSFADLIWRAGFAVLAGDLRPGSCSTTKVLALETSLPCLRSNG